MIALTTNAGTNWSIQSGGTTVELSSVFFTSINTGYIAGFSGTILKTTNNGANWFPQNSNLTTHLRAISFLNMSTGVAVGIGGKILRTTDGGTNWNLIPFSEVNDFYDLHFVNSSTGTAAGNGIIARTTNGGITWQTQSVNFSGAFFSIHFINENTGAAAGEQGAIFRTDRGGVGVRQTSTKIPERYALLQNYPNPFNPATVISYLLPAAGYVSLNLFDLHGKKVAELVNQRQSAGTYAVDFNSSDYNISSGIYFVKMQAEGFSDSRKIILLK